MNRAERLRCASGAFWLIAALAFFREPLGLAGSDAMLLRVSADGGEIRVDGTARGTSPALLEVRCRAGETVIVEHGPARRQEIPCRPGETLEIE